MFDNNPKNLTPQDIQDQYNISVLEKKAGDLNSDLMRQLIGNATGASDKKRKIPRLAYTEDPYRPASYTGLYKTKNSLLPDSLIKQIRIQNFLN